MITSQRVLVDIDCLHDTRFALLQESYPEALAKLDFKTYHTRTSDGYVTTKGVVWEEWIDKWDNRDNELLKLAKPTIMLFELCRMLSEKYKIKLLGTPVELPELFINIYPYKFNKEELKTYKELLTSIYGRVAKNIEVVNFKPETLTQDFLKSNYEMVIIYDFYQWNTLHCEGFKKVTCPSLTMVIPAFYRYEYALEAMEQIIKDKTNPFKDLKQAYAELISLEILDPTLFSLHPDYHQT